MRQRWSKDLLRSVNSVMQRGMEVPDSPFGLTDRGLADFRGVVITNAVNGLNFVNTDLSLVSDSLAGQFDRCRFENCAFVQASFGTNLGSEFLDCQFHFASLKEATLRGKFERCDLSGSNLYRATGSEVSFLSCTFKGASFRRSEFYRCLFESCEFAEARFADGSLCWSRFVGCNLLDQDLGNTMLANVRHEEG